VKDQDLIADGVATALESNGSHVAKKNPPSVISNQLRVELIRILQTGDVKNEGAFTVAIATQVEKFAVAAREILMTENLAQNDLGSLMLTRRRQLGPWNGAVGVGMDDGLSLSSLPINNENFGVQAVRQLVEAIRTMGESPAKLVEALAVARKNNLPDVVSAIEKKLGVSKEQEAAVGVPNQGVTLHPDIVDPLGDRQ
jgi:hypothetical protein